MMPSQFTVQKRVESFFKLVTQLKNILLRYFLFRYFTLFIALQFLIFRYVIAQRYTIFSLRYAFSVTLRFSYKSLSERH
jgi:ABC-type enterochelin transport system permease subunit